MKRHVSISDIHIVIMCFPAYYIWPVVLPVMLMSDRFASFFAVSLNSVGSWNEWYRRQRTRIVGVGSSGYRGRGGQRGRAKRGGRGSRGGRGGRRRSAGDSTPIVEISDDSDSNTMDVTVQSPATPRVHYHLLFHITF